MSSSTPRRPAVVAVVPARGGSQGVPGKNLAVVGGQPLVRRAVETLLRSSRVDEVVVSTDSDDIAEQATQGLPKDAVTVVRRPAELAGATASSESAVLHVLDILSERDGAEPDLVLLVQCTSPFINASTVDGVVSLVADGGMDCAFTAVRTHEFLWRHDEQGQAVGVNHSSSHRPRRQDREPEFRETGAVYAMRTDGLREYQHRFFGHIGIQEVPIGHAIEIDTPDDLEAARALAQNYESDRREPVDIVAVVTDFDGVHTDDRAIVLEDGTEGVIVSRSDGAGIARLKAAGIRLMILSVEVNAVVAARAKKLGVEVAHGVGDKAVVLRKWLAEQGLDSRHVAYVGNDLRDLDCMGLVGWPIAVADARPEVRAAARWVLQRPGGFGAIREVADRILESNSDVRRMV